MSKKPTKEDILAIQQPSTKALLTDNLDESKAYFQGLPGIELASLDAVKEAVASAVVDPGAAMVQLTRPQKLTDRYIDTASGADEEAKERARRAYMAKPGDTVPTLEDFQSNYEKVKKAIKDGVATTHDAVLSLLRSGGNDD